MHNQPSANRVALEQVGKARNNARGLLEMAYEPNLLLARIPVPVLPGVLQRRRNPTARCVA